MTSKKFVVIFTVSVVIIIGIIYYEQSLETKISLPKVITKNDPYLKEYSLPTNSAPNGLVVGKDGIIWIASSRNDTLFSFDPKITQLHSHDIRNGSMLYNVNRSPSMIWTIIEDESGKIWFSQLGPKIIWRFDPKVSDFEAYHLDNGSPFQMKINKRGEIWFTTLNDDTLGVIDRSNKTSSGYEISTFSTGNNTSPAGIFLQNDSVWTAFVSSQYVAQYTINHQEDSAKNISLVQRIPRNNDTFSSPTDLFVNKDTVWLTEHGTSFLTEYNITSGQVNRYPTSQNSFHTVTLPFWIRTGNSSNILWFNEHQGNKIALFELDNKAMTEYIIPSLPVDGYITYSLNIAIDPYDEKKLWFSEWNTDKIGLIDGNVKPPFEIYTDVKSVTLGSKEPESVIKVQIKGESKYNANRIFLNTSSSMMPTAELGNLTAKFSSESLDLSNENKTTLTLRYNDTIAPGNYTLGISASDGFVIKTIFLNLSILKN